MPGTPAYREPISRLLRKPNRGNEAEIAGTLRWAAFSSLLVFSTLAAIGLITTRFAEALVVLAGTIPILIAILYIRKGMISLPSIILTINAILLITYLATIGYGIYDIAIIGYPIVLIVVGLVLRGKVIPYMTALIIVCLGWLVFGAILGLYEPHYASRPFVEDFFGASAVILIASNAIFLLSRNIYQSLWFAQKEIEAREKAEKEREELIRQLELKNQELDRFAITVSHDLKTPLITIGGFLGLLEKAALAGDQKGTKKNIAQVNDAAKTMGRLVDEILDLSRIGKIVNPPTDVPFGEIVWQALKQAEGLLKERQIQLQVETDFPNVYVDQPRLVQVMQNLVTNAVKFMGNQSDPTIQIGSKIEKEQIVFYVQDNGIGIEPQFHEQIFGLFSKLDSQTEGTGIGLGLVKRIIEMHGGRIWVDSSPGEGSTFYFTLENRSQQEKSWLESS